MDEQPNYYDIFEGEDEDILIFGQPEPIDQDVEWVDLYLDGDDGVPFEDGYYRDYNKIQGLNGDDTIVHGATQREVIFGAGGNDTIYAGKRDIVYGGDGNDEILGGSVIYGGRGDDKITGGPNLYGDEGDDTIQVSIDGSQAYGGDGNDLIIGDGYNWGMSDGSILSGGDGNDVIYGGAGGLKTLAGDAGDDEIYVTDIGTYIEGGSGNDDIFISDDYHRIIYRHGDGINHVHGYESSYGSIIDVSAFGFASKSVALSHASVVGDDVRINFGSGNEIVLVDYHLNGGTLNTTDFLV